MMTVPSTRLFWTLSWICAVGEGATPMYAHSSEVKPTMRGGLWSWLPSDSPARGPMPTRAGALKKPRSL